MRRLFMTLAMTLAVLAGGVASAHAQVYTLTATLSGADETPTALNTGAFGTATITLDVGARSLTYRIDVFNLPSGVTASHIHVGGVGTTGPVIVNFAPPVTASNDFAFSGTVPEAQWVSALIGSASDQRPAPLAPVDSVGGPHRHASPY